jgi:hypothetical protein
MQTLKQLAAQDNLFLITEIPAMYFENEYFKNNFEHYKTKKVSYIETLPDFLTKNPKIEIGLFYEVRTQLVNNSNELDLYYIENCYWCVKHVDFDFYTFLVCNYNTKGKFYFQLPYSFYNKFYKISNHLRKECTKGIVEPNLIGVFNDKKVIDWFNYCLLEKNAYINLEKQVNAKNNTLQSEIDTFISSLNGKCKVTIHGNRTYVDTSIFSVIFELFAAENYLSKKIEFKGNFETIAKITSLL